MLVSVADFAEERKQDRDTVNAYIRNHPEIHKETVKRADIDIWIRIPQHSGRWKGSIH